jgi:hypothetical protein
MQEQILNLIAQFTAEAEQIAQELRSFRPHSDAGRYLELTRRHGELQHWIATCKAHAA